MATHGARWVWACETRGGGMPLLYRAAFRLVFRVVVGRLSKNSHEGGVIALTLRVLLALEFAGALGAWALGVLRWEMACAIATSTLIGFMVAGEERDEPVPVSSRRQCATSREPRDSRYR